MASEYLEGGAHPFWRSKPLIYW